MRGERSRGLHALIAGSVRLRSRGGAGRASGGPPHSTQGQVPEAHQDLASLTQMLSHALLQQYESLAHTVVAHAPQLEASLVPVLQTE